ITSERRPGLTGVWVGNKKIASIGITVKNWITYHGVSINIAEDDLANFKFIQPCGLDIEMTCMEKELNRQIAIEETKNGLMCELRDSFSFTTRNGPPLPAGRQGTRQETVLLEEARR
ncbi:MAG: hypothetical protein KKC42_01265, partial [Candidatus Omnitrophica bacterium]|nr:hypothetical protein [Candidatus Omnitrophota bacterium]